MLVKDIIGSAFVMLVFEENEKNIPYSHKLEPITYFSNHPWRGRLIDIYYGNTAEELLEGRSCEGMFYALYSYGDDFCGPLIGYGVVDYDSVRDDIKNFEITEDEDDA